MNIYLVTASIIWPVGDAGAVIVAENSREAMKTAIRVGLHKPDKPKKIGISKLKRPRVIFFNTTDY